MEKEFEILHLSFRKKRSSSSYGGPVNYYIGNIVFRMLSEEGKSFLEHDMEKYEKVVVCPSLKLLEEYSDNLDLKFGRVDEETGLGTLEVVNTNGIPREDVYIDAYRHSSRPLNGFLQYHDKFDCFQLREYFQDTPVVRGIIKYLHNMKDGKPNPSRTCYYHQLICTLENLCWWWD